KTDTRHIRLISSPGVDVFVGKDKKHYRLPKDLLCYHSPYFERCFNGGFKEGKDQKLELLEDSVEDFEILLEYMLHGSFPDAIDGRAAKPIGAFVTTYMAAIAYADKFAMGETFCELLHDKIVTAVTTNVVISCSNMRVSPAHIELVFRLTQAGSPLRTLLAKVVLSYTGLRGVKYLAFKDVEKEIPDFALEMLQQIRLSV
ncbi:hypothetical protein BKA65DRAFT_391264, partial [Rhexocercosporidium sp. MPI-PUGE-AT-0058]